MTHENDLILSKLSVRIKDSGTLNVIGSGLLYLNQNLKDKVYILTAAHVLYKDGDSFKEPINQVNIDIYDSLRNSYQSLIHTINHDLVAPDTNKDVAVLILNRAEVEAITGTLPEIMAIRERLATDTFTLKGFPSATHGLELVCINPVWLQKMTAENKFQLQLNEDYSSWATNGFSGSGVFLSANKQIYLYGIFTRYRAEEKGKVIYCQYIETVNEILEKNFLLQISFTFFGENGLTTTFFKRQIEGAKVNLGPRFNEELNLRMPIAKLFNDLAKDNLFKHRLLKAIDKWLSARSYGINTENNKLISEIESDFTSIKKKVFDWVSSINWNADQLIEMEDYLTQIESLNEKIEGKRSELYNLQWEIEKENIKIKKDYSYHPPYEREISRLREILHTNYDFSTELNTVNISIANHPCLIIQGDAGCGKSHLLGDIANERTKNNKPTILLLGQLFLKGQNVWQNILNQLNLTCSKEELLMSLNSIGKQINSRVLILIDALNEGAGKELWAEELAGFINDISNYPFIGLALSVRSTYYDVIVPVYVRENKEIAQITHQGFKGNEYEAVRLFCIHYKLEQPNFPLLSPEFTNPLFLLLICEGLKSSGQNKYPQGFQGVSNIFNYYLKAICDKLINKREEYRLREQIIENAIFEMAKACFKQEILMSVPIQEANELFDTKFTNYKFLLNDLIFENVFIQGISHDYTTQTDVEVIYFSYERIGDFYMANELLHFKNSKEVIIAFRKDNELGKLLKHAYGRNAGILEAMAILLPEKFKLEITEVFKWVFNDNNEIQHGNRNEWLNHFLIDSLKWRTLQSIDNNKLTKWITSKNFRVNEDYFLNSLIELTAQVDHPFNGDRLFRVLKRQAMPKRDSFWQKYLGYYSSTDDDGNAFPIRRLIDWAWQRDISGFIDPEVARLTGQTLAWVLSSTNIALRDQTTKAMVNLLEEQPDALISILSAFNDIDDLYILERLYGIAYGCTLRTSKVESIQLISQYVFDTIFSGGNPPEHILLRDYARNTIEYAIYKSLTIKGDISLIRPPYRSRMKENIPTDEQMKAFETDHNDPDFKKNYRSYSNEIHHSVMSWDFGRYIVDSALTNFLPYSFTMENDYKKFLKEIKKQHRETIKLYESVSKLIISYKPRGTRFEKDIVDESFESIKDSMKKSLIEIPKTLKAELIVDEYNFFVNKVIPHIQNKCRVKDWQYNFFNSEPIKRWIVQRVFELGYNSEIHGPYESSIGSYNNRSENKIERVGKKYQWIAFYEIFAIIADNYKYDADHWSSGSKYNYFQGAWQGYLRDVDPVFITRNKNEDEGVDIEIDSSIIASKWWLNIKYNYWNPSGVEWVSNLQDLPDPRHIILSKDESSQEWLYLNANIRWRDTKPIGVDKFDRGRQDIWYMIQGYLVHKKDKNKIKSWLQDKNFWGRNLPETHRANSSLFSRENYWSLASKGNEKEKWDIIRDTSFKVMVTTSEAVGGISQDKSGAHFNYVMPCKMIFKSMKLQYAPNDGEFKNDKGEIVVMNPDHTGVLIRKDYFTQYLDDNNLEIIWTILGTKTDVIGSTMGTGESYLKVINGVYSMEKNIVSGKLTLTDRE